jgi:RNase P subunit RPR2
VEFVEGVMIIFFDMNNEILNNEIGSWMKSYICPKCEYRNLHLRTTYDQIMVKCVECGFEDIFKIIRDE